VAQRHGGDLHVADDRHHLGQAHDHLAMDPLAVVDVELQLEVGQRQLRDQRRRLAEIVQEIARHVAAVERLQDDVQPVLGRRRAGEADGLPIACAGLRRARRGDARHHVQPAHPRRQRVVHGLRHARLELRPTLGKHRHAAVAGRPVARRHVEQRDLQPVGLQAIGDLLRRMFVGEEEFDGLEAGVGGRGEAVEKAPFVEHHRQVGGEAGHQAASFPGRSRPASEA